MPALRNVRHHRIRTTPAEDTKTLSAFSSTQSAPFTLSSRTQPYPPSPASSLSTPTPSPHAFATVSLPEDIPSPASSSSDSDYVVPTSSRVHSRKKAPGHIPRPPNAFLCFRSHFWEMERQKPESERDHRQISRLAGIHWKGLSEAQRAPFKKISLDIKKNHEKMYPDYKYAPSSKKKSVQDDESHIQLGHVLTRLFLQEVSKGNRVVKGSDPQEGGSRSGISSSPISIPHPPSLPTPLASRATHQHRPKVHKTSKSQPRVVAHPSHMSLLPQHREVRREPQFTFGAGFVPNCDLPSYTLPSQDTSSDDKYHSASLMPTDFPALYYPGEPSGLLYVHHSSTQLVIPAKELAIHGLPDDTPMAPYSGHILQNTFLTPQTDLSEPLDDSFFGSALSSLVLHPQATLPQLPEEISLDSSCQELFYVLEKEPVPDFAETPISRTPEPDVNQYFNFDLW